MRGTNFSRTYQKSIPNKKKGSFLPDYAYFLKMLVSGFLLAFAIGTVSAQSDSLGLGPDSMPAFAAKGLLLNDSSKHNDTANALPPVVASGMQAMGRFGDAIVYTWLSPLRWKQKDWLRAAGVVGGTALLFLVDKPIDNFWKKQHSSFLHGVETAGYHYGKPYAAFIATGGFYAAGIVFKSEWAKETALILGSSYLSSGAVQTFMKTAVGRARPGADLGNMRFKMFSKNPDFHSFPSGHIQMAMTTAAVLAGRVNSPVLKTLFYATASTTLISRMYSRAHWSSDLFFGGAISWFIAETNIKRWQMTKTQVSPLHQLVHKPKITWNLEPTMNGLGLVGRL